MFSSFRFKLIISFTLVVIVVLASVYFVVNRFAEQEFRDYVIRGNINRAAGLKENLVDFYESNGSWEGVGSLIAAESTPGTAGRKGRGAAVGNGGPKNLVLAGKDGRVIASENAELQGEKLPEDLKRAGITLYSGDVLIGYLLAGPIMESELEGLERQFLSSINKSIIYGALIGLVIALALGVLLFRGLTNPLSKLERATDRISSGDLEHLVDIDANDEIGRLGDSFNRMTENLRQSEEIRKRMISDIAHELRTPLTIIGGEIEAIRDGVYEPTDEKMAEIQEEVGLLNRLVEDLRELTMAESGELELEKGKVDTETLLRRIKNSTVPHLADKEIELKIDYPEDISRLNADGDRIFQVMTNLIKNSYRHTPEGGKIMISVKEGADSFEFVVADTGEGMPADKLPHIFERFYRADRSRAADGTGLGLSIAKELVEAHGGTINAESAPGEGTKITFTLPK